MSRLNGVRVRAAGLIVTLALLACADEMPRDVQEATTPAAQRPAAQPGADATPVAPVEPPAGGYAGWAADMRAELDVIRQEADDDRSEALALLQQLYVSRYEPLQTQFGEGGSAITSDAMAQAVERTGSLLRQLMRLLAETDAPSAGIDDLVQRIQQTLAEVEAEGDAAGLTTGSQ